MLRKYRVAGVCGLVGVLIGGLPGLLLGVVAGLAIDRMRSDLGSELSAERGQRGQRGHTAAAASAASVAPVAKYGAAFSVGAVVLSAKLAKVDGHVSASEIQAFRRVFYIPDDELGLVATLFDRARRDALGYRAYARELGRIFAGEPRLLEELVEGLARIALADGTLSARERRFLEGVCDGFGMDSRQLDNILSGVQ
ncbi:MAG: TerB family tellurite resistance protein [Alphaproteobacteria bacterium]